MLAAGTQIGPYTILSLLGSGGMGEVYRARDNRLERQVAIKVLPPQFTTDADRLARFEREAKAVAALAHPNIVVLHDFACDPGLAYAVTELLEGESFRALTGGPVPWRKVVELGVAVADGLAAAHAKGIVHRDLKPENLFLTTDGRIKILDFGLAQVTAEPSRADAETKEFTPGQTDTGIVLGTAGYMAPEQMRADAVDQRSDLFSLGCVLYELAAGRHPFQRETSFETQTAILREEPTGLEQAKPPVPAELARVLQRCLGKRPQDRFQSAADLAFALRSISSGSQATDVHFRAAPARRRRPLWPWLAATAVLVLALGGLAWWWTHTPRAATGGVPWRPLESLAVLPFETEGENQFLGDSVAEEIINQFGQMRQRVLKVKPWTSVSRYKGRAFDVATIGRTLGVQALIVGNVRQHGSDLSIHVALVDAREDVNLWSKTLRGRKADLLALQGQMMQELTEALRERVPGLEGIPQQKAPTTDPKAYLYFVEARAATRKWTKKGAEDAIALLDKALEIDPKFALAYATKADALVATSYLYGVPKKGFQLARAAAEKAVEIDKDLAEGFLMRGVVAFHEWEWATAEIAFRKALQLKPDLAAAHDWYADYLVAQGKTAEAIRSSKEAIQLEPDSAFFNATLAFLYMNARQYDESIAQCKKTLAIDPTDVQSLTNLGFIYALRGRYDDAVRQIELALEQDESGWAVATLGWAYALAKKPAQARAMFSRLQALEDRGRYIRGDYRAAIWAGLGDKDEVFAALYAAVEECSPGLLTLLVDPTWDGIREDPRYGKIVAAMGLKP